MNHTLNNLSDAQIDFLHRAMEGGNSHVCTTLEMLTGQSVDQHSVRIKVISGADVLKSMNLGPGPLTTVVSSVHGEVEGDFLLLFTERDFQTLSQLMGPALHDTVPHTAGGTTDYMIPDFIQRRQNYEKDSKALQAQMLDAVTEMGSVLFGAYLTALYSDYKLATYQDLPNAKVMDNRRSMLEKALSRNSAETNIAIVIEIDYVIAQKSLKAWLLMLPLMSRLRALLDSMDTDSKDTTSPGIL